MRRRLRQRTSLRTPSEPLAALARHLALATIPAFARWRLMRRASLFNDFIVTERADHFRAGLDALHDLSPDVLLKVALVFSSFPQQLRIALQVRLAYLGGRGTREHIRSFLDLIPRMADSVQAIYDPVLSKFPEARNVLGTARAHFAADPKSVMDHIVGESLSGSQLSGGGHLLSTFEMFADVGLAQMSERDRAWFRQAAEKIDVEDARMAIRWGHGDVPFDLSGDRWMKFFLQDFRYWRIAERHNGVMAIRLPRRYFNSSAWKNTVLSARNGTSPIGGKSLFPHDWTMDEIRQAVVTVLDHPEPVVLRYSSGSAGPSFFIRAVHKGVLVEVGILGGQVRTAFPSWRQQPARFVRNAYLQWLSEWSRLREAVAVGDELRPFAAKLKFPDDLKEAYFDQKPDRLTLAEWEALRALLSPAHIDKAQDLLTASNTQIILFDWMHCSRVVQTLEGDLGSLR